jgi:hypothetical protein
MLRIMKYLSKAEIGQMLIALVTIVGQVYFDLKLPDYMSDITTLVETPGSHMKDIWIAGGKMLLISHPRRVPSSPATSLRAWRPRSPSVCARSNSARSSPSARPK